MNTIRHSLSAVQWGFLGYFIVLNVFYVGLAFIAMFRLRRYMGGVAAAESSWGGADPSKSFGGSSAESGSCGPTDSHRPHSRA